MIVSKQAKCGNSNRQGCRASLGQGVYRVTQLVLFLALIYEDKQL